jgi:hypothetical protein
MTLGALLLGLADTVGRIALAADHRDRRRERVRQVGS